MFWMILFFVMFIRAVVVVVLVLVLVFVDVVAVTVLLGGDGHVVRFSCCCFYSCCSGCYS